MRDKIDYSFYDINVSGLGIISHSIGATRNKKTTAWISFAKKIISIQEKGLLLSSEDDLTMNRLLVKYYEGSRLDDLKNDIINIKSSIRSYNVCVSFMNKYFSQGEIGYSEELCLMLNKNISSRFLLSRKNYEKCLRLYSQLGILDAGLSNKKDSNGSLRGDRIEDIKLEDLASALTLRKSRLAYFIIMWVISQREYKKEVYFEGTTLSKVRTSRIPHVNIIDYKLSEEIGMSSKQFEECARKALDLNISV